MSERREQRRVERTAGIGKVTRGGAALGTARYVMEIWQTFHVLTAGFGHPGPAEEVAGLMEIRIRLTNHDLDTFKLVQESATLTLHLEDGRHLDGFLNGDEFVASGQLTQA
jgi:hypothetical protein